MMRPTGSRNAACSAFESRCNQYVGLARQAAGEQRQRKAGRYRWKRDDHGASIERLHERGRSDNQREQHGPEMRRQPNCFADRLRPAFMLPIRQAPTIDKIDPAYKAIE